MVVRRFDHKTRCKVEEMENELVRMLGLNIEWAERFRREIGQIRRNDQTGSATDRGRQDVAVISIGKEKSRNEVFIPCDERIRGRFVHQPPCALELFPSQVGPVLQEI